MGPGDRFRGVALTTGSAGTIACGDYLKKQLPGQQDRRQRGAAVPDPAQQRLWRPPHRRHRRQARALDPQRQEHRHGDRHRRRGRHVSLIRLFNEPAGSRIPGRAGRAAELVCSCDWLGISGIANVLSAIKFAKYYEMGENDVVLTVLPTRWKCTTAACTSSQEAAATSADSTRPVSYHRYLLGAALTTCPELGY